MVNRPPAVNEGQRLLCEVSAPLADIGKAAGGASKGAVAHWRSGLRKPDAAKRRKLAKAYGIAEDAWDRAPAGSAAADDDDGFESVESAQLIEGMPSAERFLLMANESRAERIKLGSKMQPGERVKSRSEERACLALFFKLKESHRRLEDLMIREHPHWARFEAALLAALEKHPEAAESVAGILERLGL